MSLVGPRPCLAYECENYEPWHWQRFETPPGLTGFWQVKGKNRTTFEEMIDMDLYYVKHKSLLLDLSIMARTIPAIVQQVMDQRRNANPFPPGTSIETNEHDKKHQSRSGGLRILGAEPGSEFQVRARLHVEDGV